MTEQSERYDRISEGYARWWAPVIAPAALAAIDEIAAAIDGGARRVLDVGTGTGRSPSRWSGAGRTSGSRPSMPQAG